MSKQKPLMIKAMSFDEVVKEAAKRYNEMEENFKKTGLCQANVEVSDGVWEPCKRQADPKNPQHFCKECQESLAKTLKELAESQGPGDFLMGIKKKGK